MSFWTFLLYLAIAFGLLLMSILLGDRGPWYFAWILGTVMAIVIAVAGGVLFEAQEEREQQEKSSR
jgi:cyd operon protein YbgT